MGDGSRGLPLPNAYAVGMEFPIAGDAAPRLELLASTGSTNTWLREAAVRRPEEWPDGSVVVTLDQRSGRGRLDRSWLDAPGRSLAVSVLLRPRLPAGEALEPAGFGWLPLLAGLALRAAAAEVLPQQVEVSLKWPNDLLLDGRKAAGVLAELLPDASAVVIGAGVNLRHRPDELPLPGTASFVTAGAEDAPQLADALLGAALDGLRRRVGEYLRLGADADASGARAELEEQCSTLGRQVRVELPGERLLEGVAIGIDEAGRLIVRSGQDGRESAVAAGDITHLRY